MSDNKQASLRARFILTKVKQWSVSVKELSADSCPVKLVVLNMLVPRQKYCIVFIIHH